MNLDTVASINVDGRLISFDTPKVMGIVNVTPDSFYAGSRVSESADISDRVRSMLADGADILDIGGYSSRPGADEVTPDEEYSRLARGLEAIHKVKEDAVVSVDTFRADVARRCVEEWNVGIINDIAGGDLDPEMWDTVTDLNVPYVLMHMRGNPKTMGSLTDYKDVTAETLSALAEKTAQLRQKGVRDVVIDPGFGFAKTVEQNYQLLSDLKEFKIIGAPVLVGISRKTMIWKPLGITPDKAANGTTVLNTIALLNGADILRVHDVRNAVEAIKLISQLPTAE
jgi:dihydropteroate synthase